jgi:spore coat polysaccharide biosynthesis predicted glycosyltransferase SpsG
MLNITIVIPALSYFDAFKNALLTKLAGKPLIEHAIDKFLTMTNNINIYIITDNEEIQLISSRKGVETQLYFGDKISFDINGLIVLKKNIQVNTPHVALISPYALLLEINTIRSALEISIKNFFVRPVMKLDCDVYSSDMGVVSLKNKDAEYYKALKTFILCESDINIFSSALPQNMIIKNEIDLECKSRHAMWVYEKLINRKRIVFYVAASKEIGMGHIYRALSLAHEIIDHEVVFVCDDASFLAISKLAEQEYPVYTSPTNKICECIKGLMPSLVINDVLDTDALYIDSLMNSGIKTINFEDLGEGALKANYTINDLYDEALYDAVNTLWGHEYFFVRDEFYSASPHTDGSEVESVLLTFGGTDQNDFTRKFYHTIKKFCNDNQIKIYIVTGEGYGYLKELEGELKDTSSNQVEFIHKTGIMSSIMEKTQIAISSNGRTVYELAHMNIPTIVISHHDRESNHKFSCYDHGFINLGTYMPNETETKLSLEFQKLVHDKKLRSSLVCCMKKFNFLKNKIKINNIISSLIS